MLTSLYNRLKWRWGGVLLLSCALTPFTTL
jgi:hypothetical protein